MKTAPVFVPRVSQVRAILSILLLNFEILFILSGEICEVAASSLPSNAESSSGGLLTLLILGAVVVLSAVGGYVFYKKRKGSFDYNKTGTNDDRTI